MEDCSGGFKEKSPGGKRSEGPIFQENEEARAPQAPTMHAYLGEIQSQFFRKRSLYRNFVTLDFRLIFACIITP